MHRSRHERRGAVFLAAAALGAASGACAAPGASPSTPAPLDTVVVVDTLRIQGGEALLQDQVAQLQLRLLERDVQLIGLQEQLDAARQEVVRTMAKLQSQASRAEAASGMAEADIALAALGRVSGGSELVEHREARQLLAESTVEFNAENYGGALYLATQARTLALGGQSRLRGRTEQSLLTGEALFALPVPLRTVGRANVRGGPGLGFEVLFTLDGDVAVLGQSHTSQWVRVVDEQARDGWIFHTLLAGR